MAIRIIFHNSDFLILISRSAYENIYIFVSILGGIGIFISITATNLVLNIPADIGILLHPYQEH